MVACFCHIDFTSINEIIELEDVHLVYFLSNEELLKLFFYVNIRILLIKKLFPDIIFSNSLWAWIYGAAFPHLLPACLVLIVNHFLRNLVDIQIIFADKLPEILEIYGILVDILEIRL
jgi:hypothetical protein